MKAPPFDECISDANSEKETPFEECTKPRLRPTSVRLCRRTSSRLGRLPSVSFTGMRYLRMRRWLRTWLRWQCSKAKDSCSLACMQRAGLSGASSRCLVLQISSHLFILDWEKLIKAVRTAVPDRKRQLLRGKHLARWSCLFSYLLTFFSVHSTPLISPSYFGHLPILCLFSVSRSPRFFSQVPLHLTPICHVSSRTSCLPASSAHTCVGDVRSNSRLVTRIVFRSRFPSCSPHSVRQFMSNPLLGAGVAINAEARRGD
jgi:hypothetical protein